MGIIKNILTLGASARIDNAVEEYESLVRSYEKTLEEYNEKHKELGINIEKAVNAKKDAVILLKKANKLFSQLSVKDRNNLSEYARSDADAYSIEEIDSSISSIEMIKNYKDAIGTVKNIESIYLYLFGKTESIKIAQAALTCSKVAPLVNGTVNFISSAVTTSATVASGITAAGSAAVTTGMAALGAGTVGGSAAIATGMSVLGTGAGAGALGGGMATGLVASSVAGAGVGGVAGTIGWKCQYQFSIFIP